MLGYMVCMHVCMYVCILFSGFLCEDFNLAIGFTRNIKICKVFNALHFVTHVHFGVILTKLNTRIFTATSAYASSQQAL